MVQIKEYGLEQILFQACCIEYFKNSKYNYCNAVNNAYNNNWGAKQNPFLLFAISIINRMLFVYKYKASNKDKESVRINAYLEYNSGT